MKDYLMKKIKEELPNIKIDNMYAISFFLDCNSVNETIPLLSISSNDETDDNRDSMSEDRWNYAFWKMNVIDIVCEEEPSSIEKLKKWYIETGIKNPGYEDLSWDVAYDNGRYIGKGPEGLLEFIEVLKKIVIELHESGYIKSIFGKSMPIIIHDLEYTWFMVDATVDSNPYELIKDFKAYNEQW